MKFDILVATFPFGGVERITVRNWLIQTRLKMERDPRIGTVYHSDIDDTPVTVSRNRAMEQAKQLKVDFTLMIDSDMWPDIGLTREYADPSARPFWETAFEFLINHHGPAVIAAPYCGPPPHENVYVFKPSKLQSGSPDIPASVEQFTREEAAQRCGIEEVFALPTGLMLIDMRCVDNLRMPYFDYEYEDERAVCGACGHAHGGPRAQRASTEDVYASRNMALAGVPQYCAWDCWAGHWKTKLVGKPTPLTMDMIRQEYRDAVVAGQTCSEKLTFVRNGQPRQPVLSDPDFFPRAQPQRDLADEIVSNLSLGRGIEVPAEDS